MIQVPITKLIPYANNARTHTDSQISQIAGSIKEFGFNNPVLIDSDFGIIAGHGRVLAGKKLGLDNVPCVFLHHLTAAKKKAYILADNKLALNASWNDELLKLEIDDLHHLDFNLELIGFDKLELNKLLGFDLNEIKHDTMLNDDKLFVIVDCISETEQQTLYSEMKERGFTCKLMN